mgnify:CR=1 FL=1
MANEVLRHTYTCPVCGKDFYIQEVKYYVYKRDVKQPDKFGKIRHKMKYYCSYGCMNNDNK